MSMKIAPDVEKRIAAFMAAGQYESCDHVLRDALDALEMRLQDRAAIAEGIEDEQLGRLRSLGEVDQEMRARYSIPRRS